MPSSNGIFTFTSNRFGRRVSPAAQNGDHRSREESTTSPDLAGYHTRRKRLRTDHPRRAGTIVPEAPDAAKLPPPQRTGGYMNDYHPSALEEVYRQRPPRGPPILYGTMGHETRSNWQIQEAEAQRRRARIPGVPRHLLLPVPLFRESEAVREEAEGKRQGARDEMPSSLTTISEEGSAISARSDAGEMDVDTTPRTSDEVESKEDGADGIADSEDAEDVCMADGASCEEEELSVDRVAEEWEMFLKGRAA